MVNEEKIQSSLEKIKKDIDSIKQELKSPGQNSGEKDFKTIVHRVEGNNSTSEAPGSARLEGNIETI